MLVASLVSTSPVMPAAAPATVTPKHLPAALAATVMPVRFTEGVSATMLVVGEVVNPVTRKTSSESSIIAVCAALTVGLQYVLAKTRFGSRLRASVDDARVAAGLGIRVNLIFAATFAVGSGLAGLGGALGAEVLGLDPTFPLKFMVYFLIVVAVGGTSSITGPLWAALLLGIADVAGKYYMPKLGSFIVYSLMIAILIWRPQGLFVRKGGR